MAEFADHASVLVGDVDCTAEGKELCEEVGVEGYPTLKHGDPNNLEDYEGERDLESLRTFAKENLGPRCGPGNLDLCDANQRQNIERFMAMPRDELKMAVKEGDAQMKKADD